MRGSPIHIRQDFINRRCSPVHPSTGYLPSVRETVDTSCSGVIWCAGSWLTQYPTSYVAPVKLDSLAPLRLAPIPTAAMHYLRCSWSTPNGRLTCDHVSSYHRCCLRSNWCVATRMTEYTLEENGKVNTGDLVMTETIRTQGLGKCCEGSKLKREKKAMTGPQTNHRTDESIG